MSEQVQESSAEQELRWVVAVLNGAEVPYESYEAQAGGMCRWTVAGRVDHLIRLLQKHEIPLDEGVIR